MDSLKIRTIFWQCQWKIPNTPWTISGYSRSAFRTGFYINELDLLLDAGPHCFNNPRAIMITHSHLDHIVSLPLTMIDGFGDVYVPEQALEYVKNYISSMYSLNALHNINAPTYYNYKGLKPGETFRLTLNNSPLTVEIFRCDHSVPTVGYGLSEVKTKLKSEYLGMQGKEIAKLRRDGVQITHEVTYKRMAYVCDTTIKVFDLNPTLLEYPTVFIECTFLLPDEVDDAKMKSHIHWNDLKPYVESNPHILFVPFHFSQRYRDLEIDNFFKSQQLPNIKAWTTTGQDDGESSTSV